MRKHSGLAILLAGLMLGLTNCSTITQGIYGIKNPRQVNKSDIEHFAGKYNIPGTDSYELDTSYLSYLFSFDTSEYKVQVKNHYQPLQALYYRRSGQLQSFQINCYAGGFPNLDWGRNGAFETFPPKQQALIDSILPLEKQLDYLIPLPATNKANIDDFDYVVIVFWNRFMGRQSKRLIRYVQENRKLALDRKVKTLYANTDNLYISTQGK